MSGGLQGCSKKKYEFDKMHYENVLNFYIKSSSFFSLQNNLNFRFYKYT